MLNQQKSVVPDDVHPKFNPDLAHQLLILSYQRCGSSFFGDIFGQHHDVMYAYEPLDGLYVDMYGTKDGWNVPSDITNYSNGSIRWILYN